MESIFFGVLIEHYGGAFPTSLAPVRANFADKPDRHMDYANGGFSKPPRCRHSRRKSIPRAQTLELKNSRCSTAKGAFTCLWIGDKELENGDIGPYAPGDAGDLGSWWT